MPDRVTVRLNEDSRIDLETVRGLDLTDSQALRFALEFTAGALSTAWRTGSVRRGQAPDIRALIMAARSAMADTEADS